MFDLICTRPFGDYFKGQRITDQEEIAGLKDREHHFVRVAPLPPPPPQEEPEEGSRRLPMKSDD